jgi:hypothetical protein
LRTSYFRPDSPAPSGYLPSTAISRLTTQSSPVRLIAGSGDKKPDGECNRRQIKTGEKRLPAAQSAAADMELQGGQQKPATGPLRGQLIAASCRFPLHLIAARNGSGSGGQHDRANAICGILAWQETR